MKQILTLLVISYPIYSASTTPLKKTESPKKTNLVEKLEKEHNTTDLSKLLHHVLDNTTVKIETVIAPKGVLHNYEVTTIEAIKQLIVHGADKKKCNIDGITPHRRLFRILQGAATLRMVQPIKVSFMGLQVEVNDQPKPQLEIEVPYNSNLNVGGTPIPRALLIGDPFIDKKVQELLYLLDPDN